MLPELNTLLQYRNEDVLERFARQFPEHEESSNEIFSNLMKYFWICQKHRHDLERNPDNTALHFNCVMQQEMQIMDDMWHTFIIFTQDYFQFCETYFGEYLHHIPNVRRNRPQTQDEYKQDLELFLSYAYDHLGEETITAWFAQHFI